jgi:hypothetical protein
VLRTYRPTSLHDLPSGHVTVMSEKCSPVSGLVGTRHQLSGLQEIIS